MLKAMNWLAILGALAGVLASLFFSKGFGSVFPLILMWALCPLPLAWWLSRHAAKTVLAQKIVLAGMAVAVLLALWLYVDAIHVTISGRESLAGLILIFGPMLQLGILAVALIGAVIASLWSRRAKS
jgi:hypothetical protein